MVAVAQLVRALVCGTGGRGFKSPQPPHLFFIFPALQLENRKITTKNKALIKKR